MSGNTDTKWAVIGASGWVVFHTIRDTEEEARSFLRQTPFDMNGYRVGRVTVTVEARP